MSAFPVTLGLPGPTTDAPAIYIGQSVKKILPSILSDTVMVDKIIAANGSVFVDGRQITAMSVPTESSRHNCSGRPDSISKLLASAIDKHKSGPIEIHLCVKTKADVLPTVVAAYRSCPFVNFKTTDEKKKSSPRSVSINVSIESGEELKEDEKAEIAILGESTRIAQGLVDLPPNELNPDSIVDVVREITQDISNVKMQVITDCKERGFNGLYSVGKSSPHQPKMIVLSLQGTSNEAVAIVGKTLCYDSGGYSLKGSQHQLGMKRDMGGGAAALGAFVALAKSSSPPAKTLHCILCVAENMIGPSAYRNDDVIQLYSGKTVEINNTDAEGRLVLVDGLAYAHKDLKCDTIIDIATLTGAALVASGKSHASMFTLSSQLAAKATEAGKATGDLVHDLVFCPELHRENIKSSIADMKNAGTKIGDAPSALAATFLYDNLVGAGFKSDNWIHIDIASVVDSGDRATGYGVGLLTQLVKSI